MIRRRRPVWADARNMELLVLGAVITWPNSTRKTLATATAQDMNDLLEPLQALINKGYVKRKLDEVQLCGRYIPFYTGSWNPAEGRGKVQPAEAGQAIPDPSIPPEPPFGIYTCYSNKCGYLYVHDDEGWFYVYDADSHPREPLKWGIQNRMTWAEFQEEGGDCTRRPLRRIKPDR